MMDCINPSFDHSTFDHSSLDLEISIKGKPFMVQPEQATSSARCGLAMPSIRMLAYTYSSTT